ncbi:MAG: NFACT RNA binding domain-containing protein [Spirochaetaceae bacterium]|jgi:predicted ribosome quality control (RQC) complex YloA/Tae2 family protein|nr:NFACT RNA binding domain-containing protein [Spirochaetaceae bacterium]
MSLNWKEIDLVLSELHLEGAQIQKIIQSDYNALCFSVYGRDGAQNLLVVIAPGVCRLHTTRRTAPKSEKPLRFSELLKSRICNARIEEAVQLGSDRIIRFRLRRNDERLRLYVRLWSNAANVILTGDEGIVIDAMRRLPKRGEVSGGHYVPEAGQSVPASAAPIQSRPSSASCEFLIRELPGGGSFNEKIDDWYAERGGAFSLEALRAQAVKLFEGGIGRLGAALEHLKEKEKKYFEADRLKEYGEIILATIQNSSGGSEWLETADFFNDGSMIRIKLDPQKRPQDNAAHYFEQYRKAKHGLSRVQREIIECEAKLDHQQAVLNELLLEKNPLKLQKLLKTSRSTKPFRSAGKQRPGIFFKRGEWFLTVGRDAAENDELLRKHVKGNDLWLHTRDFPGSYVFVKARAGKTIPLNILLDAGNLALFYSKGRAYGKGDLFLTHVKYLRRARNGPKGLVIPSQEKNLAIELDEERLRDLETCRIY